MLYRLKFWTTAFVVAFFIPLHSMNNNFSINEILCKMKKLSQLKKSKQKALKASLVIKEAILKHKNFHLLVALEQEEEKEKERQKEQIDKIIFSENQSKNRCEKLIEKEIEFANEAPKFYEEFKRKNIEKIFESRQNQKNNKKHCCSTIFRHIIDNLNC